MQKVKEQQNTVRGTVLLSYWAVLMTLVFVIRIDLAKASVALRGFLTLDPAAVASFCKYFEVDRKLSRKDGKWKNPTYCFQ